MREVVVVIEDEPELLSLLREVLELSGFGVRAVLYPTDMDAIARSAEPSLFLIDLMLPGSDGIAVAEQLRERKGHSAPMVAMSASSQLLVEAAKSGLFVDTLPKPFDVDRLVEVVDRYAA